MLLSNKDVNIQGDWSAKFAQSFLSQKYFSCIISYLKQFPLTCHGHKLSCGSLPISDVNDEMLWLQGPSRIIVTTVNNGEKSQVGISTNQFHDMKRYIFSNYQKGHSLPKYHYLQFLLLLLLWL